MKRLIAPALLLTLAACNQGKQETSAGGEILEGSASDAMLPLDTVRSQAPLAPSAADNAAEDDAPADSRAAPAAAPSTAPSATPSETAVPAPEAGADE